MKNKRYALAIIMIFSFIICNCTSVYSVEDSSEKVNIKAQGVEIGKVYYEGYEIGVEKILVGNKIGYCIQIDKDYPRGEVFIKEGSASKGIENLLLASYPNVSTKDLGLTTEDDAYLATQIALWSYIEGYDVNKISGENPDVVYAIRQIYSNALKRTFAKENMFFKQYYLNDTVQQITLAEATTYDSDIPDEGENNHIHEEEKEESNENEENKSNSHKKNKLPAERG